MTSVLSVAGSPAFSPAVDPVGSTASADVWFFLVADADPGMLPRVLGQFAKRSLVPDHVHCTRAPDGLHLDVRTKGTDPMTAQVLDGALRQIVGVRSVLRTGG